MRAAQIERPEGPAAVAVRDVADPPVAADRVLIAVEAAGAGHLDVVCCRGRHQLRPTFPFTPGFEVAGRIRDTGATGQFSEGDRVMAYVDGGGYAELALADPALVVAVPSELSMAEAAALPVNVLTALYALHHRVQLRPAERVIVHGGGGGLGIALTQVARALGATVIAITSTDAKAEIALRAGANECVVGGEDWPQRLREIVDETGPADVAVDPVGADRLANTMRCLVPEGRMVSLGFVAGIPQIKINKLLVRNLTLIGADWQPGDEVTRAKLIPRLGQMLAAGELRPLVSETAPLDEAAEVLERLENRELAGKAVLTVHGSE